MIPPDRSIQGFSASWEKPAWVSYEADGHRPNIVLGDPASFAKCEGIGVFEAPLEPAGSDVHGRILGRPIEKVD